MKVRERLDIGRIAELQAVHAKARANFTPVVHAAFILNHGSRGGRQTDAPVAAGACALLSSGSAAREFGCGQWSPIL